MPFPSKATGHQIGEAGMKAGNGDSDVQTPASRHLWLAKANICQNYRKTKQANAE